MAILFLIGSFISTFFVFYLKSKNKSGIRSAFLKASLLLGLVIAVSTELLSAISAFKFNFVLGIWVATFLCSTALLFRITKTIQLRRFFDELIPNLNNNFKTIDAIDRICLATVGAILAITLTTALVSPPNNMDSMSYHMPRVMHWIQNASISHYPTNTVRQISFPPGAGYAVAHVVLLSGNDYFANVIQWASFLGCILGVSLIAAGFCNYKGQIMSALFCATIPMAILQSSTMQTDLLVAYWLVCCAYFVFRAKQYSGIDLAWISLALSLAILTKPTAYFFGFPLGIVLLYRTIVHVGTNRLLSLYALRTIILVCCVGIGSIALSIPSYWRNYHTFDDILGPDSGTRCTIIGFKPLVSNLTRNMALNLPLPDYWRWVETIHDTILELDIDDERTTFAGNAFSKCPEWLFLLPDEDFVGNPLHLMLLMFSAGTIIIWRSMRKDPQLDNMLLLLFTVICGILIFNLLIKWQIWGNRLLLATIVLSSPVAGRVISLSRRPLVVVLVLVFLLQGSIYSLFAVRHPLISLKRFNSPIFRSESIFQTSRENLYFNGNFEYMKKPIRELNQKIISDGCRAIGIKLARPEFEYPVWAILNDGRSEKIKIKHIDIDNLSKRLAPEFSDEDMCATADVDLKSINYRMN